MKRLISVQSTSNHEQNNGKQDTNSQWGSMEDVETVILPVATSDRLAMVQSATAVEWRDLY